MSDVRRPKSRRAAPRRRTQSIRLQLMLFLCSMSLFLLVLVLGLGSYLLQPRYNAYIYEKLDAKLEYILTCMDDAIADGQVLTSWYFGQVVRNDAFWSALNESAQTGALNLTNCCVDISDRTMRSVNKAENLHPCLIHDSIGESFGNSANAIYNENSAMAIRLRADCFAAGSLYEIVQTSSGSRQMVVGGVTADGSYCVLVSASIAQVDEAGTVFRMLLPGVAALLFLVSMLASWLFSRWFTQPLTRLSRAANSMAEGYYDVRVPVSRRDELGLLSEDFNHMAGEVQRTAQLQQDLLANVSHDLRTPLTLIKGYAETVRDITGADERRRTDQLNIIIDETDRLSALVNSVMELSKVSSGAEKCERVRFDIAQLCEEVADRYAALCARNGLQLLLDVPADRALNVWADPSMIERALHNLLGNAMHHIGADGVFILRAMPDGDGVRVEVEDHGPGIAPEDMPRIFDRYYRSRSDAGKTGTGLGLSITKAIFVQHGARFGVESTPGQGACFWFVLPDRPQQPPAKKAHRSLLPKGGKAAREPKPGRAQPPQEPPAPEGPGA